MPLAPDLSGRALDNRYELHAVIGEGAFGRVYRAFDRRLERSVAVKLIKPWWSEDPEWARSLEREAQMLARVSDPGIVQIFDVGQGPEGVYYVSELVEGESLAARLARGPVPPWEAAGIAEQIARALARAHAQSVIHRDVKPANVLLASDGRVKVADFGVARLAEGTSEGAGATIVGTPRYMAPEQARGRAITPATDVYSAGVVLYEMIAGRPPFTERAAVELALRHLHDPPPPLPASTPEPLCAVVLRALAKAPQRRFADGSEMARALAEARAAAPAAPARNAAGRARSRARSHRPVRAQALVGTADRPGLGGAGPPPVPPRTRATSPAPTRRAPVRGPRRNVNPAARRRSLAALAGAGLLLAGMITAALVLGAHGQVRVPHLLGLRRGAIESRARSRALTVHFARRHSSAPRGTAIGQHPAAGRSVAQGGTVRVILSSGPPPVRVPQLAGDAQGQAVAALAAAGLRARVTTIAAPGVPAGAVTSQSPAPGALVRHAGTVALDVAEVPHWQPLDAGGGSAAATTLHFRVRGSRWRVVYTMGYEGTCTLIFICSGPSATISTAGHSVGGFDLSDGVRQSQVFATGPGDDTLTVTPGDDTARWSVWVEDWY